MAEQSSQEKTEKPSPQKLKKARSQGQVPRSRDLATAIGILASIKLTVLLLPGYLEDFRTLFAYGFAPLDGDGTLDNVWSTAFSDALVLLLKMLLPLFAIPLAIILAALVPGGWVMTGTHLMPRLSRLSPVANLKRLFTAKHAAGVLASILKAVALGLVIFHVARSTVADYVHLQHLPLDRALIGGAGLMLDGLMGLCAVFVVFALIDVPVQRLFFLREQRMSKQEVKEEYKTTEGRPEVRQRIRQLQNQLARRSVRKSVPAADVLIVNPTHYAVALKYDEQRAQAPFVIAKGIDEMALYIRQVAAGHGIEIVTLPPLARAIYNTSQVNQQIPAALYAAVAQVLNYVLQLKAFQAGRRNTRPALPGDFSVPSHMIDQP